MNKQSSAICVQKEKFFTKEQVEEETKKYFNGDDLACDTWIKKYALKDTSGLFLELTPEDMHVRMAKEFARIEETYIEKEMTCDKDKLSVYGKIRQPVLSEETIFSLFDRFRFIIPQGSVMAILGNRNTVGSLSNCIVLPQPYDSYGGICYTDQQLAQLYKRRCGCGVDISTLRPDGVKVTNAAGTSTGAVSFMERFSNTTREVGQKGRRGALMISIDIRHPDIFKFITAKEDLTKITGANISVKINDEFMIAVKEGKSFTLKFPVDSPTPTIHTEVDARTLWDEICRQATECAEPGIMFWDRHHYYSTSSIYPQYKNITTNPCFTGDTEVAVADGRNRVRFDVLASQGVDIPVYCVDDNGKVCIRMMRKPRMTRSNQKIYAVKLDDGSIIKCTEDHKFYLSDGSKVECKNLKTDDSLMISSKWQTTLNECLYGNEEHKNAKPYWMINNRKNNHLEHRFIYEQMSNDKLNNSFVIHHKDHNGLNNNFLNLEKLLKEEHNKLHNISGDNNPMRYWWNSISETEKNKYRQKISNITSGEKNGNYSGKTDEQILDEMILWINNNNRPLSPKIWKIYGPSKGFPYARGNKITSFINKANCICGYFVSNDKYINREFYKYYNFKQNGHSVAFINGTCKTKKVCKRCKNPFYIKTVFSNNEYCSAVCVKGKNCQKESDLTNNFDLARKSIFYFISDNNRLPFSIIEFSEYCKKKFNFNILSYTSYYNLIDSVCERYSIERIIVHKLSDNLYNKQISDKINQLNIPVNHKVVSVEFYGIEDVYCGTVDEFHNFGIAFNSGKTKSGRERFDIAYVSNCAEIAMSAGDSCRLICVNLYSFITNPFTKEATLDEELLYRTCYEAQRIGDDLVDLELECIERILKKIDSDTEPEYIKLVEKSTWQLLKNNGKNGRRTGVGITGLADMLAAVGIRYDSKEALNFVENVMKLKCQAEFDSSIDMSITRGCFTGFDTKFEDLSHFVKMMQIEMPEIYSRMMKYGRRNISVSTAAPTGSVSIETQTSSGCEPVYELEYIRRKKINIGDTTIPDEVDESGDSWKNFKVVHPKYSIWISNNPDKKPEESPYYNSTAYSINWMKRIEMQAILQKYITHSISSTINLPAETDVETVKQIYMYGWEKGLKGLTIYRQGSRQGILISKTEKKKKNIDEIEDVHAPRRPDTLECEIHYSTIGGQQWIFLVGLLKDRPYEIFGGERTTIHIPTKYKTGWIKRNGHDERGGRIYDLIIGDINNEEEQFIYRHIQTNFSAIKGSYTRLISLQLRHGVPIKFIHDQLLKTNESDMMSFERGVSRVLKKYIGDGEKSCSRCPECKSKSLIYEEKCFKCVSCGFTGCY